MPKCLPADFHGYVAYFSYNCHVNINGHEYAKPQLEKTNIGCQELDNSIMACEGPAHLQIIPDGLDESRTDAVIDKRMSRLSSAFTKASRKAGYRYPCVGNTGLRQISFRGFDGKDVDKV